MGKSFKRWLIASATVLLLTTGLVVLAVYTPGTQAYEGGGGSTLWVCVNDYSNPIYYNARGVNCMNYVMQGPMSIHVNSVYVEINNNFQQSTRNLEELGWAWDYAVSTTRPKYFWALMVNGVYFGGRLGLLGNAPKGQNTQLQIYMAEPTNTPWAGGYLWNYLINNNLVAQLEGANSQGCAHTSSERFSTSVSNYAHFWDCYSMRSAPYPIGQWQLWSNSDPYYSQYWDPGYTWQLVNQHNHYVVPR